MAGRGRGHPARLYHVFGAGWPGGRALGLRHADPGRLRRGRPGGDGRRAADARAAHAVQPAADGLDPARRRARGRGPPPRNRDDRPDDRPPTQRLRCAAAGRARRGIGSPLKRVIAGLGLAAAVWTAAFRGPRSQFWLRMSLGVGGLGAYALATEPAMRRERLRPRDFATGLGSAAGAPWVFQVGDPRGSRVMPSRAAGVLGTSEPRTQAPRSAIATTLGFVIGPGEELFWRGLVQRGLMRRYGRIRGTLIASSIYGGIHVVSANLTLTGAAATAGLYWG